MGEVYLAEDTRLKRRVALKSLSESWARQPDARRRLMREARAAAALNHPNIAAVYDVVEFGDTAHIVMEYVPGESLAEKVRAGPLDPGAVAGIAVQLCDALIEAHSHGVIHRDLKPANLIVTPEGRVKVLDFGLAESVVLESSSSASAVDLKAGGHRVPGTLPYVPPEALRAEAVDERGDIYSTGVLLYELLTGRRPFASWESSSLASAILNQDPPGIREINAAVPAAFAAIVEKLMARKPGDRLAAPVLRQHLTDLQAAVSAVDTVSMDRHHAVRASRPWARRPLQVAAGLLITLVGAGVGLVTWWRGSHSTPTEPPVPVILVLPPADASAEPQNEALGVGIAEILIASLARLPGVNVLPRSAIAGYPGPKQDVQRVARYLGADYVLDGSLQRSSRDVRVTLNLIKVGQRVVAWSGVYDSAVGDFLGFQTKLAASVGSELRLRLAAKARVPPARTPPVESDSFAAYGQALSFLARRDIPGNVRKAVHLLEKAVGLEPGFALAYAALAQGYWMLYADTKDATWTIKAQEAVARALELDPQQVAVRVARAVIYKGTGHLPEAAQEIRSALQLQPDSDEAHELLGEILAAQGQRTEALAEIQRAVELRPNYWKHYEALGRAYLNRGETRRAAETYQRIIDLHPESAWGYAMLGTVQLAMGERAEARRNLEHAIQIEPDPEAYSNLGFIAYEEGKYQEAADDFKRAVDLQPGEQGNFRNLGDAYSRLGRIDDARAAYRQAAALTEASLRVNPTNPRTMIRLAVYQAKLGDLVHAKETAARAVALAPSEPEVVYYSGVTHTLVGDLPVALAAIQKAKALGYSVELMRADDDLAPLRAKEGFRELLKAGPTSSGR
jgi:serine/threonine-protein kinase